jgi:nucleotide-binding universal stress UspA family protein
VLVAIDGSPAADGVVAVGIALARGGGHDLVFAHAEPAIADSLFTEDPLHSDPEERLEGADEVLGAAVSRATEVGVKAEGTVLGERGARHVAAAIVGTATAHNAEVIVVGTRGHGGLAQAILGSVSHEITELASVPVIVVHEPRE